MADSSGSLRAQPDVERGDPSGAGAGHRAPAAPRADHAMGRTQWLVLCLLFLGSSAISVTGLIFFIGWIVAL